MNATLAPHSTPGEHRVLIGAGLVATFLSAVNISIPNAALLHIQGGLSMSDDEVGWIFSSYIAASAIVMPTTHWLAGRFGRKTVFQVSMALFTIALFLDTMATTPLQFVAARMLQGAASATLAPLSMAILLDELPALRHGHIGIVWAVTALLGILSGPAIGGYLSEYEGWHSIFLASVPAAILVLAAMALFLREKKAGTRQPFDGFGFTTFSLGIAGLQMLLDRGERLEWFASTEIRIEAIVAILGFYLYTVHVMTKDEHFLNRAMFKDRNFTVSSAMYFVFGFVLLPTLALTSPMLEELLGYPADTAGYVALPRGAALIAGLLLTWRLPKWIDNRVVIVTGMALVVVGNWRMLGYSPLMDRWPVIIAGATQGAGLGVLMPALTRAAFSTLSPALRSQGTAFFNLARLYGSTIGISVVQIFFYNNTQAMHLALAKHLRAHGPSAQLVADHSAAHLAVVNEWVTGQAAVVAIIGQFKLLMIAMLVVSPLVFLLRKPRPVN
ncbi:MAG TPA: DHA2 family efflux MFS transporter permease subunit [Luteibacter sp.]|uniref:DHA2 family efflux MFS transporter permease subunit n=1 Tax=Luteibacter sp. TaxID=1886636 RepID=UPI002D0FAE48|nr:DHA2 family efflux MFS transporter permease subunit [Luteibacter sp.]HVI53658.1 DHA2 family efflux MFS transporter permease subunit [Luteibacter sp.]